MRKMWIIFQREYAQVVKKKSFVFGLILTPAMMGVFIFLPTLFARQEAKEAEPIAIVDASGLSLGARVAESLKEYKLGESDDAYYNVRVLKELAEGDTALFAVEIDTLRQQINSKDLKYVVVIGPTPQLVDSNVYVITNSENFITLRRLESKLTTLLSSIRLEKSQVNLSVDSVLTLARPLDLRVKDAKGGTIDFGTKYLTALTFVVIMYVMIFGYGQLVMRSVIEEKGSRIVEVLVSSVTPFQLMMGKVLGLGAATFTQLLIWMVMGVIIYFGRGAMAADTTAVERILFNPVIAVFYVLFMVVGYLLYSTIFALVGSIVNSEKEAQGFIFPIVMMLMLPVLIAIAIVQEPNSTLATTISMIPFFAPTMMTMRVIFVVPTLTEYSITNGIILEAIISLVLMAAMTVVMVWVTAKIFRIGILMYGKRPTLPEVMKWVRYR